MRSTGVSKKKDPDESANDLFDRTEALLRVEGDIELMASLADIFFTQSGPMMEAVRAAAASGDPGKLENAAHRLKGSVSIFGAHAVATTSFELEKMGRTGDLAHVPATLARLEQLMTALLHVLKQFLHELQTSS